VHWSQDLVWDFTQPEKIGELARWSDTNLNATTNGLGWAGKANEYRDVTVESREPVAVGWAWHPVTAISISAEVVPAGTFTLINNSSLSYPTTAGNLYVRYSPDTLHWSTWHALHLQEPKDRQKPRLFFVGTLRVPDRARVQYSTLLRAFAGTNRPVTIDEEAAVVSILKRDADFFEREMPFIGYVEFLWETRVNGNQRVQRLEVQMNYGRGGREQKPGGHDETTKWRFNAPPRKAK